MAWNDNTNRLWLLSMATLGCAADGNEPADTESAEAATATATDGSGEGATLDPQTDGATVGDDTKTTGPTTTDGGSNEDSSDGSTTSTVPTSPFVEECLAFYSAYFECFDGGYSDEELLALCTQYGGNFDDYSEACLGSQTDYFACLSDLSCEELGTKMPGEVACNEAYVGGNEVCPEIFNYCSEGGAGGGPDSCGFSAAMCLDGNEYAVECGAQTCTCSISGVPGETFPSPGVDGCMDDSFGAAAETACGFPEGIFF